MPLNAGQFSRRVTISQRSASQDAAGQPVETWSTLATVWAHVRAPTGQAGAAQVMSDRAVSPAAYSVRVRYRTDITAAMRCTIDGISHDIAQVIPDVAGHEYTDLVCVAGAL